MNFVNTTSSEEKIRIGLLGGLSSRRKVEEKRRRGYEEKRLNSFFKF